MAGMGRLRGRSLRRQAAGRLPESWDGDAMRFGAVCHLADGIPLADGVV